jgi:hypothetical protein
LNKKPHLKLVKWLRVLWNLSRYFINGMGKFT